MILALIRRDPETQTVSLVLDVTTANIAMFAIAAHADEREAHLREVERSGHSLPEGSDEAGTMLPGDQIRPKAPTGTSTCSHPTSAPC